MYSYGICLSSHVAPTAAIKPTVTTTPTASIRPMPLQTTTAPTAHISPTQVTVSFTETTPSITPPTSTPAAAVFVRGTSPLLTATRSQTGPTVHITPTLQTAPQSQPLQTGPTVHITPTLQTAPQSQPLQTGPTVHITPTLQTAPQPQTTIGGTSVGSGSGTTTSDPSVGGATGSGSSVGGVSERPPKRTRPDSAERYVQCFTCTACHNFVLQKTAGIAYMSQINAHSHQKNTIADTCESKKILYLSAYPSIVNDTSAQPHATEAA